MNKATFAMNISIVILLLLGLIYFIFQNQNLMDKIAKQQPTDPQESQYEQVQQQVSPTPKALTEEETQIAILKYTNTTDRTGFLPYISDTTAVTLYATDCCQTMSNREAIDQIEYINEGLPITFDQKNTTIVGLKAKNPNLANTYLGISQTKEHMIAYTINPKTNKIESVEMSVSWKLYNN